MKGYFNNEKATKKTVIDGWLYTGDIARYTEDKQFFIVDRLKELIKVKGLQVNLQLSCNTFNTLDIQPFFARSKAFYIK